MTGVQTCALPISLSASTWLQIDADNAWPVGGGDPTATLLSSVPEFGSETAEGTVKTFASTAELIAAVQAALDSGTTLNMVLMAPGTEALSQRNFVSFYSDDTGTQEKRPKLTISYSPGPDPIPGDANNDGVVNDADAATLAANWLSTDASWIQGDFNGDGNVDDIDATLMAANWQQDAGASASVPEPGMAVVLVSVLMSPLFWRKRSA